MKNSPNARAGKSLGFTSFTGIGRLILLAAVILFAVTAFAQTPPAIGPDGIVNLKRISVVGY